MKSKFESEAEAQQYMVAHQIRNMVAIPLTGTHKWGLVFPLECHVEVRPHDDAPSQRLAK